MEAPSILESVEHENEGSAKKDVDELNVFGKTGEAEPGSAAAEDPMMLQNPDARGQTTEASEHKQNQDVELSNKSNPVRKSARISTKSVKESGLGDTTTSVAQTNMRRLTLARFREYRGMVGKALKTLFPALARVEFRARHGFISTGIAPIRAHAKLYLNEDQSEWRLEGYREIEDGRRVFPSELTCAKSIVERFPTLFITEGEKIESEVPLSLNMEELKTTLDISDFKTVCQGRGYSVLKKIKAGVHQSMCLKVMGEDTEGRIRAHIYWINDDPIIEEAKLRAVIADESSKNSIDHERLWARVRSSERMILN